MNIYDVVRVREEMMHISGRNDTNPIDRESRGGHTPILYTILFGVTDYFGPTQQTEKPDSTARGPHPRPPAHCAYSAALSAMSIPTRSPPVTGAVTLLLAHQLVSQLPGSWPRGTRILVR